MLCEISLEIITYLKNQQSFSSFWTDPFFRAITFCFHLNILIMETKLEKTKLFVDIFILKEYYCLSKCLAFFYKNSTKSGSKNAKNKK